MPNARYLRTAAADQERGRRVEQRHRSGNPALIAASIVRTMLSNTMPSLEITSASVRPGGRA